MVIRGANHLSGLARICRIFSSLGVVFSEHLRGMGLCAGDGLRSMKTRDGIELTPCDADFSEALEAGDNFMRRYSNAMKQLAE
jgi:hypothetical protein